jgi:histidinol-phosphate/aromatic aminotransferase/cobyric acid decarboxylase-like protein
MKAAATAPTSKPPQGEHTMKPQDLQTLAKAALMPPAAPAPTAAQALAAKVDELGALRAVIADLTKQADQIRAELENAGLSAIDGQHYSASFATVSGRTITDWETIAQRFKPSAQLIRAYTKTGKPSTRLNVTARKITH